ncbi:MAG: hypothetical protein CEN87_758, partial [Parcubacteria group bacterium Licking1014_1]
GNVGIGTTEPVAKLDVNGNIHIPVNGYINDGTTFTDDALTGLKLTTGVEIRSQGVKNIDANYLHLKLGASGYNQGAGNGDIRFYTVAINAQSIDDAYERMRIDSVGNVGIGTTGPTYLLSLGGTAARTIWMERNTTAATAGQGLTLSSGGAIAGTADLAGGNLTLQSGISTGSGSSDMFFQTATAGASATTDRTPTTKLTVRGNGNVVVGTGTALATDATAGFLHIPTSAGAQTGTPSADTTGTSPIVYDTTNNRLYVYNPTGTPAWKYIAITGGFQIPDYETADPISGEKINEGDIVLGKIDKTMSDSALHATWVTWNSVKAQLLAEARGELAKTTGAWGSGTVEGVGTETFLDKVKNTLFSLGISIKDEVVSIANLAVKRSDTEVARIKKMEMVDSETGDVYCSWIANGEWQKAKGDCLTSGVKQVPETITPDVFTSTSGVTPTTGVTSTETSGVSSLTPEVTAQAQQIIQQAQQAANNALETAENAQQAVQEQVQQVVQQAAEAANKSATKAAKAAVNDVKEQIKEEVKEEMKEEIKQEEQAAEEADQQAAEEAAAQAAAEQTAQEAARQAAEQAVAEKAAAEQAAREEASIGNIIQESAAGLLNSMWEFLKGIINITTAGLAQILPNLMQSLSASILNTLQDLWQKTEKLFYR